MKQEETENAADRIRKNLERFAADRARTSLNRVRFKGGHAYVTDGRIVLRQRLGMSVPDEAPKDGENPFPFDACDRYVGLVDGATRWFAMDAGRFGTHAAELSERLLYAREHEERERADRYEAVTCPSCGDVVFWDTERERLVESIPDDDPGGTGERDIHYPVRVFLGEEEELVVNFGYLHMVRAAFGDDILFASARTEDGTLVLLMKSGGGDVKGVLMPLRTLDGYDGPGAFLSMREVGQGDGKRKE